MTGSMRTFVTEGERERRDGSNFKGPKCWSKKKTNMARSMRTFVVDRKTLTDGVGYIGPEGGSKNNIPKIILQKK